MDVVSLWTIQFKATIVLCTYEKWHTGFILATFILLAISCVANCMHGMATGCPHACS